MTVWVVPTPRFGPEIADALRTELERQAGAGMEVRIETVSEIRLEPTGKRPVIRSPGLH